MHLHELPDQLATLRTLNKWSDRIDSPAEAPGRVNEAFRRMLSGRQGPATLEMCWDAMAAAGPVGFVGPAVPDPLPPVDGDAVKAAAKVLAGAKRPMIMVGGGAQHAAAEVRALAEALGAPVTAFRSGRGIVSEDHPLGLSCAAAWRLWRETDVIVGIANDHVLNMPLHDLHDFCVGTAAAWQGPAEWFRDWVNVAPYEVAGDTGVAAALFDGLTARGFDATRKTDLLSDDNWSVPLKYLTPDYDIPLVPIHMNCVVPPVPSPRQCYNFCRAVKESVELDVVGPGLQPQEWSGKSTCSSPALNRRRSSSTT